MKHHTGDIWEACSQYLRTKFGIVKSEEELRSIADAEEIASGRWRLPYPFVRGSCYFYDEGNWSDGRDGDNTYKGKCSNEEMRVFVAAARTVCPNKTNAMYDSLVAEVFCDFLEPVLHGEHSYAL